MNKKEEIGTDIRVDVGKNYKGKLELRGNSKQETTTENLFDNTWEQGGVDSNTGEEISSSEHIRTRYIKVFPNHLYSMSRTINTSYNMLRFYDSDKNYLGNQETENMIITSTSDKRMSASVSSMTFTIINADVAYMRLADASNNLSTIYTLTTEAINIDYPSEVKSCGDNVNLFDIEDGTNTTSGVIRTIKSGEITLNGTPNDAYYNLAISTYTAQKTGTYTLVPFKSSTNANIRLIYQVNGGSWINNDQYTQITLNKDDILTINLRIDSTNSITNFLLKPKLVLGTSIGEYSPYGLGSISEVVSNKNVFNLEEYPFVKGVAYGSDGKAYSWTGYSGISEYFPVNENTTYTFSNDLNKPIYYGLVFYDENKNVISTIFEETITFTTSKDCKYIRFAIQSDVLPSWVQIEKGDTETNYIEHQSQTLTIPTQQPMRSIGDVRDKFVKVDGIWYERHYIARLVLDGTENWDLESVGRFGFQCKYLPQKPKGASKNDEYIGNKCNYYKESTPSLTWAKQQGFCVDMDSNLRIYDNTYSSNNDLEGFKTFLTEQYNAGTPVYVDYVLAEPIDIECTEEQNIALDKLENIILYEGINHIYCLDEVSPLLRLTYYKIIEDYDMYISSNGRFIVPKYNIDYLVDMVSSTLFGMPEATENSARIAGRDGDMVLSTTYQPLNGNIVCYTEDNLTPQEKSDEERKINRFLNEIKNTFKKIAIENNNIFYEIKYNGLLTTTNFPKHIQFSIPLKSSKSYGFGIVKKEITGNGTLESNTIKECGAVFTINGPALNPIISLNDYSMEFSTSILDGATLIIDSNKSTVTHIAPNGLKTNQMKYYNHQFPKIENGVNELKVLSGIDNEQQVKVEWYDLML